MTEFSQESPPYSFIDKSVVLTKNFITLINKQINKNEKK
jgi:hypothetical protein